MVHVHEVRSEVQRVVRYEITPDGPKLREATLRAVWNPGTATILGHFPTATIESYRDATAQISLCGSSRISKIFSARGNRRRVFVEESGRLPRKLAAILYADVVDYSRLTGEDEDATHQNKHASEKGGRTNLRPVLGHYR